MWAWIENNQVRDTCHGDPALCYHPDIAKHYDTQVPDGTENGATLVDGEWVNPLPPVYVPQEPVAPAVPQVLTMRQAKLVLLAAGLLDDVDAAVSAADRATQIEWEYATEVQRDWPALKVMADAMGMTDAQLDALFIQGAAL